MDPVLIALVILFSVIGSAMGLFTGLVPGIHVNTLASIMLMAYGSLEASLSDIVPEASVPTVVCCMIMSASVVHSYVDFVPSVFIGAPDAEDAISILPGHRLLLAGQGMRAVRAAAVGSLIGCSAAILIAVPMQLVMSEGLSDQLDGITKYVLMAVTFILMLNEYRKGTLFPGILCFILSGTLGYAVMNLPIPANGPLGVEGTLLMPMLTGLFGLPILLESDDGHPFPRQKDDRKDPVGMVPGLKGVLMGSIAGWFPGITSTVGATVSATVMPDRTPERFISTVASIGTVTTVLSLVTLSISGGGRSGTVIVIGDILGDSVSGVMSEPFMMLLVSASVGSLLGYWLTIQSGRLASRAIGAVDQRRMNRAVILFLIALVFITTGLWGMAVLIGALLIGFLPSQFGMGRTALCGCLILPVLFI